MTTTRTMADIEADIEREKIRYRANEAAETELHKSIGLLQETLDRRIKETFAGEFAAIEEMRQRLKDFREGHRPDDQRLYALEKERKHARMVPGQRVFWQEPNGWRGTTGVSATVVKATAKSIQINLGGLRHDRVKWVSLDSLSISGLPAQQTKD